MLNFFTTGLLTTCVSLACVCSAQACGGACGCAMSHAMAPTATPAPAAPADPHAGMQMSHTPGTRTYQSFSYEPQAAPVLVTPRPMMMSRPIYQGGRFDAPYLHGDSKASGRYLWNSR